MRLSSQSMDSAARIDGLSPACVSQVSISPIIRYISHHHHSKSSRAAKSPHNSLSKNVSSFPQDLGPIPD
jgi:hypothetical protein